MTKPETDAEAIAALDAIEWEFELGDGTDDRVRAMRRALDAASAWRKTQADAMPWPDTYPMPAHGWTCFHCGETFTTPGSARDHFGCEPCADPACRIKVGEERGLVMALRKAEKELERYRVEDSDADRHFHAMRARAEAAESQIAERDAEIARLREALAPFAGAAVVAIYSGDEFLGKHVADYFIGVLATTETQPKFAWFDAASAALSPPIATKQDEPTEHEAYGAMIFRGKQEARNNGGDDE